nr:MAG TPA: hypothetical protein [Caudoviricetes sp.]DAW95519.1 MAG TPA: hypothetical protein [Bacteriophage sp.]
MGADPELRQLYQLLQCEQQRQCEQQQRLQHVAVRARLIPTRILGQY